MKLSCLQFFVPSPTLILLLLVVVANGYVLQECESVGANQMIEYLREMISKSEPGEKYGVYPRKLHTKVHPAAVSVPSGCCLRANTFKPFFTVSGNYALQFADDFTYTDPVSLFICLTLVKYMTSY